MRERREFRRTSGKGGGAVVAVVVLIAAMLLCGVIVYYGPAFAETLIPYLPATAQQDMAVVETLFSLVIFGGLLLFAIVGGAISGVNPFRTGRNPLRSAGIGLAIGVAGVVAAASLAWVAGTLAPSTDLPRNVPILLWGAALILFQTASEEIYFRGWLQPVLVSRWGKWAGIVIAALAFSALHVMGGARSPTSLLNLFLGGLLFGFLAAHKGGLAAAIGAHFAWNASEQIMFGLDPNPGVGSFGALIDLDLAGAAAWGGSDEGLNASIGMTAALFALIVPIWMIARAGESERGARPQAAE